MESADAISVATEIARNHGLTVEQPVPLRSTNNAVAWLAPSRVVAKVGVGLKSRLAIELRVAKELAELGAPAVSPATELPVRVHSRHGLDVTFWRYHPQPSPADEPPAERIAPALRRLHSALANISPALRACLPYFLRELGFVCSLLSGCDCLPALSVPDRNLLRIIFDRLKTELEAPEFAEEIVVLHGAPHSYNTLHLDGEPHFIDFETACTGPVEWDLAHLGPDAERFYGGPIRPKLLWACRAMVSVTTATLCWADVERGDLRDHAEWHLSQVKSMAPRILNANDHSAEKRS